MKMIKKIKSINRILIMDTKQLLNKKTVHPKKFQKPISTYSINVYEQFVSLLQIQ